ncbi:MAG: tetratricopeptide repeat protein [Blastocatellia bacterium]
MMTAKKFHRSILALSLAALPLLIVAAVWTTRPATDPISRSIQIASQLTETHNEQRIRDWLFTLILSGREKAADTFARQTTSDVGRVQAYVFIADAATKAGKTDKAQEAIHKAILAAMEIKLPDARLSAIARISAIKGDAGQSLDTARQITDGESRLHTFSDLCQILIEAENFDAAIGIAHDEVYPWLRPSLLLQIADGLLEGGQTDRGKGIAQEAFELALGLSGGGDDVLEPFAPVIVRAGLANELLKAFEALEKRDVYISDQAFESIAIGFAKIGNIDKALAVARNISKGMPITAATSDGRARALGAISQTLREAGYKDEAESILTEALETALRIEFPSHRSWALHKIAPLLVKAGRTDEALKAVRGIGRDNEPLAFVAVSIAESGNLDEAEQAAFEAFTIADNFEHIIRSGVLIRLVKALLKAGSADKARMFVEIARQKLEGIKDSIYKSDSYKLVAEALALLGDWDQAIVMAELCGQEIDQLAACTAIVREHSITQNPSLAEVFRKAPE